MRSRLGASLSSAGPGLSSADALCVTCVGLLEVDGAAVSVIIDGTSSGTFGSSSPTSRRLDEHQFTYGEGPCLDAVAERRPVLAPDLDDRHERRWPAFRQAVLADGIRGVFAVPIVVTSQYVGALDLFRARPGPLSPAALAGAHLAAEFASAPLLDLLAEVRDAPVEAPGAEGGDGGAGGPDDDLAIDMDRVEVYQATGILIAALDLDADAALLRLRAHAISTDRTASEVAKAIVAGRLMLDRDDRTDGPGTHGGPR